MKIVSKLKKIDQTVVAAEEKINKTIPNWIQVGLMIAALFAIFGYLRAGNPDTFECITNDWCIEHADGWWWLAAFDTLTILLMIGAAYVGLIIALRLLQNGWYVAVAFISIWGLPIALTSIGFSHYGKDMSEFWGFQGLASVFWILAFVLTIAYWRKGNSGT